MVVTGAGRSDAPPTARRSTGRPNWLGSSCWLRPQPVCWGRAPSTSRCSGLFGLLIAAATLLALITWPPTKAELRLLPVVPALALAAWAVLDGALVGVAGAGVGPALLLIGIVAVLLVCRRLGHNDGELLLAGVIGIGLLVALTGWLGVAGRSSAWAFQAQGLWRASATLTYPNATAAVLAPIGLVVLGRLVATPASLPLVLAATGLLTGLVATMSRAGVFALVVGLVVLAGLRGLGVTARAVVGPVAGALVAMLGLLPSMPAAGPPRPVLAVVGLGGGLALAAMVARLRDGRRSRWPPASWSPGLPGCCLLPAGWAAPRRWPQPGGAWPPPTGPGRCTRPCGWSPSIP